MDPALSQSKPALTLAGHMQLVEGVEMSFIGSLSNPEGLYIWEQARGIIYWLWSKQRGVMHTMPSEVFYGLFQRWHGGWYEDCEYEGATIEKITDGPDRFRYLVSYDGWSVTLWHVTLMYVANNIRYQFQEEECQSSDG